MGKGAHLCTYHFSIKLGKGRLFTTKFWPQFKYYTPNFYQGPLYLAIYEIFEHVQNTV